jgi:hypothetical protein
MMIRLTLDEWNIVKEQCRDCIHWSDITGCKVSDAASSLPFKGCYAKRTERADLSEQISIWLTAINQNLLPYQQLSSVDINELAKRLSLATTK